MNKTFPLTRSKIRLMASLRQDLVLIQAAFGGDNGKTEIFRCWMWQEDICKHFLNTRRMESWRKTVYESHHETWSNSFLGKNLINKKFAMMEFKW